MGYLGVFDAVDRRARFMEEVSSSDSEVSRFSGGECGEEELVGFE